MKIFPSFALPNKSTSQATKNGFLPIKPQNYTKTALILPQLTNNTLLSIGQLCDEDCIAIFDKKAVNIYKNAKIILTAIWISTNAL